MEHKSQRFKFTPLHIAIINPHIGAVRLLLESGAKVNEVDSSGDTALDISSLYGCVEVVRLLLEYGARSEKAILIATMEGI